MSGVTTYPVWKMLDLRDDRACGVPPRAVVEPTRAPHPSEEPPVAHTPRVIALTGATHLDALVADPHVALDPCRLLEPRRRGVRERCRDAGPREVDGNRDLRPALPAERVGRVGERDAGALGGDAVLPQRLDRAPRAAHAVGRDLDGRAPVGRARSGGPGHGVIAHDDERLTTSHEVHPVPRDLLVRVQPEPQVAAVAAVGGREVVVPRLAPQQVRCPAGAGPRPWPRASSRTPSGCVRGGRDRAARRCHRRRTGSSPSSMRTAATGGTRRPRRSRPAHPIGPSGWGTHGSGRRSRDARARRASAT